MRHRRGPKGHRPARLRAVRDRGRAVGQPRVVATGPWRLPDWDERLRDAGCLVVQGVSIDEAPDHRYAADELCRLVADADAILVSSREQIGPAVLAASDRLRIVAKATIGVERIDVAAATARAVLVTNAPAPANVVGLAEATIGLVVALAKELRAKERRLREGGWRDATTSGLLLEGRTIGIVGLGRVGRGVARRLAGWNVRILATDPYVDQDAAVGVGAELVPLETLLRESDVVTLHVPLTAETRGMLGRDAIETMRPGAILVNTSRGPVVEEEAVAAAVRAGHLAGVALDVFEQEPLPADSVLRTLPPDRVILTPHSVGSSLASRAEGTAMAVEAILSALGGRVPEHVVDPRAIPAWDLHWKDRPIVP